MTYETLPYCKDCGTLEAPLLPLFSSDAAESPVCHWCWGCCCDALDWFRKQHQLDWGRKQAQRLVVEPAKGAVLGDVAANGKTPEATSGKLFESVEHGTHLKALE